MCRNSCCSGCLPLWCSGCTSTFPGGHAWIPPRWTTSSFSQNPRKCSETRSIPQIHCGCYQQTSVSCERLIDRDWLDCKRWHNCRGLRAQLPASRWNKFVELWKLTRSSSKNYNRKQDEYLSSKDKNDNLVTVTMNSKRFCWAHSIIIWPAQGLWPRYVWLDLTEMEGRMHDILAFTNQLIAIS